MTAADRPNSKGEGTIQYKKYAIDENEVSKRGVESTLYVTAVDGVVKEYTLRKVSRRYLDERRKGCKNQHLGTLRLFEKYWVNKKGFVEC
jgi:hypothetical protein